ncbi:MAG: alkaline phosphatase family protein [Chloroflexota bacterium]
MLNLFNRRKQARRVLVLGLDCASPHLIFDQFKDELPTFSKLAASGTWGELTSSIPCITVPAWASMTSSRDPGVLGVYGFRNRKDFSYDRLVTADSDSIRVKRVWDTLSEAGKQSVLVGVPQTYPPHPVNGSMVTDFLTPGREASFTYPAILKAEILKQYPNYKFDVSNFRSDDKERLLQDLLDMTAMQTGLVKHLMKTKPWDFFMFVNIGVDRLHHGFWHFHDPLHRLYTPGNRFEHAIRDYYKMMDSFAAELLEIAGDETTVLVVSDHGVSRMDGGICINEWLWRNGWLSLKTPPKNKGGLTPIEECEIDWANTRAWASGGYYGRVFLNMQGREPNGTIAPERYEVMRDLLASALASIPDPNGQPLNTQIFKPQEVYQQVNNIAPDLLVYFGDLHWRAIGSLGHGKYWSLENDTGPDYANHAVQGMFILNEPGKPGAGRVAGHQLMDIAPTLLDRFDLPIPAEMQGKVI